MAEKRQDDLISELGKLGYLEKGDTARLMGVILALAGELFVAKARHERLLAALDEAKLINDEQLRAGGESERMKKWLASEEAVFGANLLEPFLNTDVVVNSTAFMRAE